MNKLDTEMTYDELQECLMGDFGRPSAADRRVIGIPMAFFTLIGLHLNITLYRIISIHKGFIDRNFKRHVVSLICSSIGFNLTGLCCLLPIVSFNVQYPDPILIAISTPDSFFYQVTLYNTLTIALDRFMMFIFPRGYELFSGKKHFIFVLSPWILAGWIVFHSTYLGCHKRFNIYQLRFQYGCSGCPFYLDLLSNFAIYMPIAVFTMYFCIFASILRKKFAAASGFSLRKQKKDLVFVIQFTIITVFQVCASMFFYVVGYFTTDVIFASLLMLTASCWNTYTNPLVMFVFQERIRKSFLAWSSKLWIFSSDLKILMDSNPSRFIASQAPSGTRTISRSTYILQSFTSSVEKSKDLVNRDSRITRQSERPQVQRSIESTS